MPSTKTAIFALASVLLAQGAFADFRFAATPKSNFVVRDRNGAENFATETAAYMEPATFGYAGLNAQRNNNYDNFLRSNIDNEQDNRNFNTEAGQDMLPFRTLNAVETLANPALQQTMTFAIGSKQTLPVRWNNPHSSECEVNVWIKDSTVVVPIKKPVCCGEGYQDGVIDFVIPADFNQLAAKVPGFTGCNKVGDCVLQVYAHSVEPRTYAVGTPLILTGGDNIAAITPATDNSQIAPAVSDPGFDISKQPRAVCLPAADPTSYITSAQPRAARLVSDVFNHAYQNSDYSPYSGQQQEAISQNLQASSVIRMVATNGGELGQALLTNAQKQARAALAAKITATVQKYEKAANNLLNKFQAQLAATGTQTIGNQKLATCERCVEAGSVNTNRLTTTTYIPSFIVPDNILAQAQTALNGNTKSLISNDANGKPVAGIYLAAFKERLADLNAAIAAGDMKYQPAAIKAVTATMPDATRFRKVNAAGQQDGGKYAATQALNAMKAVRANAVVVPYPPANVAPTTADKIPNNIAPASFVPPAAGSIDGSGEIAPNPDDDVQPASDEDAEGASSDAAALQTPAFMSFVALTCALFAAN